MISLGLALLGLLILLWFPVILPIIKGTGKGFCAMGRGIRGWWRDVDGFLLGIGIFIPTFFVALIWLLATCGSENPEVNRLVSQSYVGAETNPTIRAERMKSLAERFPKDGEAQKCIRNHTFEATEPDAELRKLANQLSEKLPTE